MMDLVRKRYEFLLAKNSQDPQIKANIKNFDRALLHSDKRDRLEAAEFAKSIMV